SRMRSLYALHLSLSVAIPAIQPRLRLSGTNCLRSAFHGGQRKNSSWMRSAWWKNKATQQQRPQAALVSILN
ncbi:MAG: hypothetical protein KZQ59_01670, partial [Candidatus Thiodiazotropha sp. (ex Lucinoma aequizonata)]|nr:hypothetical protein [Candidatus Thiodiazotropha sp. (ex Lucinoma aequizonata)]